MSHDPYHTPPDVETHPQARLHWRTAVDWSRHEDENHAAARIWEYDDAGHAALYRFVCAWAAVAGDLDE